MTEEKGRRAYPTDLTDAQWDLIHDLIPPNAGTGRPTEVDLREVINGILYLLRTGCQWAMLPHDLPHPSLVRYYFKKWRDDGTWEAIQTRLRERVRVRAGRNVQPSAGIVDTQSVKTTEVGGERGFDGNKKINGRKRHVLVDTMGCLLGVLVCRADITDREGLLLLLGLVVLSYPLLKKIWADQNYTGDIRDTVASAHGIDLEVVYKVPQQRGFVPLPRRWVVERFFGWLNRERRLSKDYEHDVEYSEAWIHVASISRMLRYLAPNLTQARLYERRKVV